MSVKNVERQEKNKVKLTIEISAEAFEAAIEKVYRKNKGQIAIPGFRKGKAPRKLIEKMYGAELFYEEAINEVYPQALDDAIVEEDISVAGYPKMSVESAGPEGVVLIAEVAEKPEISVENYKGVVAPYEDVEVTEHDIEVAMTPYISRAKTAVEVDRPVEFNDTVNIDFIGYKDGEPFPGGSGEDFDLVVGSCSFIPGFEEQVVGHTTGEEFDVNVTFPEDYQAKELAGKEAVFKIKLHEIKVKELPEVDDDFVKDVSDFDTLDEYKADVRKKLEDAAEAQAKDGVENQLIDKLVELVQAEIPEAMYTNRINDDVRDFAYRLQSQGLNLNTYLQYTGMNMDGLRQSFRPQAERQVKVRLALEKIAGLENIQPTDADLEAEYEKLAKNYELEVDKVKSFIPKEELVKDIAVAKAIQIVRDTAVVTEADEAEEAKAEEAKDAE